MLTLGLFTFVVNVALMVVLVWVTQAADIGLTSDSFLATLLGGMALTVSASILNRVVE